MICAGIGSSSASTVVGSTVPVCTSTLMLACLTLTLWIDDLSLVCSSLDNVTAPEPPLEADEPVCVLLEPCAEDPERPLSPRLPPAPCALEAPPPGGCVLAPLPARGWLVCAEVPALPELFSPP